MKIVFIVFLSSFSLVAQDELCRIEKDGLSFSVSSWDDQPQCHWCFDGILSISYKDFRLPLLLETQDEDFLVISSETEPDMISSLRGDIDSCQLRKGFEAKISRLEQPFRGYPGAFMYVFEVHHEYYGRREVVFSESFSLDNEFAQIEKHDFPLWANSN